MFLTRFRSKPHPLSKKTKQKRPKVSGETSSIEEAHRIIAKVSNLIPGMLSPLGGLSLDPDLSNDVSKSLFLCARSLGIIKSRKLDWIKQEKPAEISSPEAAALISSSETEDVSVNGKRKREAAVEEIKSSSSSDIHSSPSEGSSSQAKFAKLSPENDSPPDEVGSTKSTSDRTEVESPPGMSESSSFSKDVSESKDPRTLSPEKNRARSSSVDSSTKRKSGKALYEEARRLKSHARMMQDDTKPPDSAKNLESSYLYFMAGLKFMEHAEDLAIQNKLPEAEKFYFDTASYFDYCLKLYSSARRQYLSSLVLACKAWCCHTCISLRKNFVNKHQYCSTVLRHASKIPGPSAGVSEVSPRDGANPLTPTLVGVGDAVSLSRSEFQHLRGFIEFESKCFVWFFSSIEQMKSKRPSVDLQEKYKLNVLELEKLILSSNGISQEDFVHNIRQEIAKAKDIASV